MSPTPIEGDHSGGPASALVSIGDRALTLIVLAKEPLPGRVKTRLQAEFTAVEAAGLAACAIEDSLRAVRSSLAPRQVLFWEGNPQPWNEEFEVIAQPSGSLNDRLAAAFAAVQADGSGSPVLLIGMDTPQVTAKLLDTDWEQADAALGLSDDGGFWAVGLRSADPQQVFSGIPMSTKWTGSAQLARLSALGLSTKLLPPLRDVDLPEDAAEVAGRYPQLSFSRRYRELVRRQSNAKPSASAPSTPSTTPTQRTAPSSPGLRHRLERPQTTRTGQKCPRDFDQGDSQRISAPHLR